TDEARERAPALRVRRGLLVLDGGPLGMSGHGCASIGRRKNQATRSCLDRLAYPVILPVAPASSGPGDQGRPAAALRRVGDRVFSSLLPAGARLMQTIGRYEIIEELGRGAMGVVYRARDTQIGRVVALKVVLTANASAQDIEKFKQRFNREAQAAGRLSHPGIVTIHDIAEDDSGQPYIVMEFVEGRPLNLLLGPTAQVPLERLLDIGIQVAQALDYAHKNGVVHRDIKPPNILVTPDGRVKIADFGIARLEGTELTLEGTSLGTPSYMSPEQFRGGAVDGRSDIFSLGAVLYWMFTGKKPFPGDTVTITSFQVAFENPVLPSLAKTGLPKDLDEILTRCLAKNPESRYATCADLAADLDAVRHGRPLPTRLTAKPDSTEPFPLPSRRIEPARPDATVPVPVSDPEAKTRVGISTDQFASR